MKIRIIACTLALSACTTLPPPGTVIANSETAVTAVRTRSASGDPALWTGGGGFASGLAQSGFLAATSRDEALVIHDLQGAVVQRVPGARLANIDVAAMPLADSYAILIGGSEQSRGQARVVLYRMDLHNQTVRRWAEIATDLSEPAGFCMRQVSGVLQAVIIDRRGEARQLELSEGPDGQAVSREVRRYRVGESGEGCAIDPTYALVYFSHARSGFWRYSLAPAGEAVPARLVTASSQRLPRSRGVVFLTWDRDRLLVSLDEDNAAFSVWRARDDHLDWLGRIEVREQSGGRAVRNVAGLDAYGGPLGPYADGVVVVQDQANDGAPNLKLISWSEVWTALGL